MGNMPFLDPIAVARNLYMEPTVSSELDALIDELTSTADIAAKSLMQRFEELKARGDFDRLLDFSEGFANGKKQMGEGGRPCPGAPIKYAIYPRRHAEKFLPYIPYFEPFRGSRLYEIGVGPGYLFEILRRGLGIDMLGCDIRVEQEQVYKSLRTLFGITRLVEEQGISYGQDFRIPEKCEGIVAFWTVFNRNWNVPEHEWFLARCRDKTVGQRALILRFNNEGFLDKPDVVAFYRNLASSSFPIKDDPNFCIVNLNDVA